MSVCFVSSICYNIRSRCQGMAPGVCRDGGAHSSMLGPMHRGLDAYGSNMAVLCVGCCEQPATEYGKAPSVPRADETLSTASRFRTC
jgi:hypothetical protein